MDKLKSLFNAKIAVGIAEHKSDRYKRRVGTAWSKKQYSHYKEPQKQQTQDNNDVNQTFNGSSNLRRPKGRSPTCEEIAFPRTIASN